MSTSASTKAKRPRAFVPTTALALDDISRLVANDSVAGNEVSGAFEPIADRASAGVGLLGAGVADGDDVAADRLRCLRLVFARAHEEIMAERAIIAFEHPWTPHKGSG